MVCNGGFTITKYYTILNAVGQSNEERQLPGNFADQMDEHDEAALTRIFTHNVGSSEVEQHCASLSTHGMHQHVLACPPRSSDQHGPYQGRHLVDGLGTKWQNTILQHHLGK